MSKLFLGFGNRRLGFSAPETASSDDPYAIETFDTTYSLPTGGTTWYAYHASGGSPYNAGDGSTNYDNGDGTYTTSLARCFTECSLGDVIILKAGQTYSGNYYPPDHGAGTDWIYVTTSAYSSLPAPGTRVSPSDATNMATIESSNNQTQIITAYGSHHYRFVGLEFKNKASTNPYAYVWLGYDLVDGWPDTDAEFADNITIDRCYLHGDTDYSATHAIDGCGKYIAVVDCYCEEIHALNDSQCFSAIFGAGPYKIVNNYLEAAGENVMFGGASSGGVLWEPNPSNIEVRRNHMFKPLEWDNTDPSYNGKNWGCKNLFELKMGEKVWIEGNVFQNSFNVEDQSGNGIVITPRENIVQYVTFRNNIVTNSMVVFSFARTNFQPSDIRVQNNLCYPVVSRMEITNGGVQAVDRITFEHNTLIGAGTSAIGFGETSYSAEDIIVKDCIFSNGSYGIIASGRSIGIDSISFACDGYEFDYIILIGGNGSLYTGDANVTHMHFPANDAAVGFVDTTFNDITDFALDSGSDYYQAGSDGTDIGADISAIIAACNASDLPF